MTGYMMQAVLVIFFLYLITFKVKEKSVSIFVFSLILAFLALFIIAMNIYMISASKAGAANSFLSIYRAGILRVITGVVMIFVTFIAAVTIGIRSSNIEDINYYMKKNHGEGARQIQPERVSLREIFPGRHGKWILTALASFIAAAIAVTFFFTGYLDEAPDKNISGFDELDISSAEGVNKEAAVELLNDIYNTTESEEIKKELKNMLTADSVEIINSFDYFIETSLDNYYFFNDNILPQIPEIKRKNTYTNGAAEFGQYKVFTLRYYTIQKTVVSRYYAVILYGMAIDSPSGTPCELINIHIVKYNAPLSYGFFDFQQPFYDYEFEYDFLGND